MVRASIKEASALQRKSFVPDSDRTADRTKAADWIEANAADEWEQWTMTDVADETGYTREHIATTLEHYFEPAGQSRRGLFDEVAGAGLDQEASGEGFQAGYTQGFEAGALWALRNHGTLQRLFDE